MSKRKKQRKPYSDPYGKNKPLQSFQGRCRNNSCSIAVYDKTLLENDGLCPFCFDVRRMERLGKSEKEIEEKVGKREKRKRKGKVEKAGEILEGLSKEEIEILLSYIQIETEKKDENKDN